MAIKIICIGKKHEDWVRSGVDRYQKRLKKPFDLEWTLLPHALSDEQAARRDESSEIMKKLSDSAFVILLDERGKSYSSPQFTDILLQSLDYSRPVVIVIGGAYGVDKTLQLSAVEPNARSKARPPVARLVLAPGIAPMRYRSS